MSDKMREACRELVEWWGTGVCRQDGEVEAVRLELEADRGDADMRDAEREITNRLVRQAALTQQPESKPNRIQRSKLEFLAARDDYVAHRDESVIRVSFAGYKHCYLDRFGRVLWLNGKTEGGAQQPEIEYRDSPR